MKSISTVETLFLKAAVKKQTQGNTGLFHWNVFL